MDMHLTIRTTTLMKDIYIACVCVKDQISDRITGKEEIYYIFRDGLPHQITTSVIKKNRL